MSKGLQELIEKFESKKVFCEVKIKTRQSFREDQAALDRRLSKYRTKSVNEKDMSNGETNEGYDNGGESECVTTGVESKLESIVLDVCKEKTRSSNGATTSENGSNSDNGDIKNNVTRNGDSGSKSDVSVTEETVELHVSNENEYSKIDTNRTSMAEESGVNGHKVMNGKTPASEPVVVNGKIPTNDSAVTNGQTMPHTDTHVGNGVITNGHIVRERDTSSMINRPRVSGVARTAVTPEPSHKLLRGIYQKNPKLTPSSTDHLDNVSLTGFRVSGNSNGSRIEPQKLTVSVPPIPAVEVTSLPPDGNVGDFSVEHMVTFFRLLRLPEELIYKLSKCKVDGKRFSVFSDKELKEMGINNPIVRYFRDRTAQRPKRRIQKFML